jgi:hypothetical protein
MKSVYPQLMNLNEKSSIAAYCDQLIPVFNQQMRNFEKHTEPDGFIYFYIGEMESFGSDD